jgi:hypothetical protein
MRANSRTAVIIAGVAILSIVALLGVQTWATVAIRKTRLHRQLAEHLPALTSPR